MNSIKLISFTVIIFLITISNPSIAQSISFGIKGGLNISGVTGKFYMNPEIKINPESKLGFNVYLFAEYDLEKYFSLLPEVGFTQKGFSTNEQRFNYARYDTGKINVNATVSYLDVSLLFKFKITLKELSPYIFAGPSWGIKGNTNLSETEGYPFLNINSILVSYTKYTFGLKFGAGTELSIIPKLGLLLEVRYNTDLTVSYNTTGFSIGDPGWYESKQMKNYVFEFIAGVKF